MAFSQRHGDGEAEKLSETGSDISQIGEADNFLTLIFRLSDSVTR